jgi:hypothetical protein
MHSKGKKDVTIPYARNSLSQVPLSGDAAAAPVFCLRKALTPCMGRPAMRTSFNRRTATKVRDGRVQRKNRSRPTGHERCVIDRQSPARGYRHVVTKRQLQDFIAIIPDWKTYSERLRRIVLGRGGYGCDGQAYFYRREESGVIYLDAWQAELWQEIYTGYFAAHSHIFERLGVAHEQTANGWMCRFTESQVRAFLLLHVFVHELGHHYDNITKKHHGTTKGEDYAEHFANSRFDVLFPEYVRVFGTP